MDIDQLMSRIRAFQMNKIMEKIFGQPFYRKRVITLNQNQLFLKGITARGTVIRTYAANSPNVYSHRTINIKQAKGQKTNVVTLKDTGEFYSSFTVKNNPKDLTITANFKKPGGNISDNVDITDVLGLTDENKETIQKEIMPQMIEEVKNMILNENI